MAPGPMFALTLAKSYESPWAGIWVSLGHAVVEVPLVLLIYFGFAEFFKRRWTQFVLSIVGAGMIMWLGIAMFNARLDVVQQGKDLPYSAFVAGILTSALNPFFLLWWATVGSMLIMRFVAFGRASLSLFVIVHWLCDLLWLSFVSVLVYNTRSFWAQRFQEGLFIASSLLLVGFGVWFAIAGVRTWFGKRQLG
ncbi:MAG: LysE family transporter [Chloroflexi bacterium]|nr:LysE family transporter [Chloroflexota bacterium]